MDTLVTITVVSRSSSDADEVIDKGFHEIERLEKAANFYSPDSEISQINTHAGYCELYGVVGIFKDNFIRTHPLHSQRDLFFPGDTEFFILKAP